MDSEIPTVSSAISSNSIITLFNLSYKPLNSVDKLCNFKSEFRAFLSEFSVPKLSSLNTLFIFNRISWISSTLFSLLYFFSISC